MNPILASLPNLITLSRVACVFPVMWLISTGDATALWLALAIMVFCEFTDWLDGYAARRIGAVSTSGKVLDPMADSLYRIGVFVVLVSNGWMPLWMLLILVMRDVGVSELRLVAQRANITLGARSSGKIKAVVQGVAQFAAVILYAIGGGSVDATSEMVVLGLLFIATAVTFWSLVDYTMGVFASLRVGAVS